MVHAESQKQIKAQYAIELGQIELIRSSWQRPITVSGTPRSHHLELALLPRSDISEGCFTDTWSPTRFEPIGDLFLLPAGKTICANSACQVQESIVLEYDPQAVSNWFQQDLEWTDSRLLNALDIGSPVIRQHLLQVGEEIRSPGFASETMLELLAAQLIIELSRHLLGQQERKISGGLPSRYLQIIDQRLHDDSSPPNLTELAELCGLSVRHLTRAFRLSRGKTIGQYIAEHRINHAKQLLAAGMSVKSVAYTVGFSAPSNFTIAFVKATGETPRTYRLRTSGKPAPGIKHQRH